MLAPQLADDAQGVRPLKAEADEFRTVARNRFVHEVRMLRTGDQFNVFFAAGVGHQGEFPGQGIVRTPLPQLVHVEELLARPPARHVIHPCAKPAEGLLGVAGEHVMRVEHDPARGDGGLGFAGGLGGPDAQARGGAAKVIEDEAARGRGVQEVAEGEGGLATPRHAHNQRVGRFKGVVGHGSAEGQRYPVRLGPDRSQGGEGDSA